MKVLPPANMPWNYRFLMLAFAGMLLLQLCVLLAWVESQLPMWRYAVMFGAFDAFILGRAAWAKRRGELGRGWLAYAALCVVFVPLVSVFQVLAVRLGLCRS
jgi:hypothetical protein